MPAVAIIPTALTRAAKYAKKGEREKGRRGEIFLYSPSPFLPFSPSCLATATYGKPSMRLHGGPFAHVVALGQMTEKLQHVAQHERPDAPAPLVPGKAQKKDHAEHGQGNAQEVNGEVERMPMAFTPVCQARRNGRRWNRFMVTPREFAACGLAARCALTSAKPRAAQD